jgi:putative oxidoreductase
MKFFSTERLAAWSPLFLSLLRIVAALVFLEHGTQKLLGFPPSERAGPAFGALTWWAGIIEIGTGALLALGLYSRPAAFLASGTMAFAYWIAHAPRDVFPVNNGGDAAILYCFLFLYLVFAGPGPWSLDALRRRR